MKPLKLTMTAFGPYKDTEVINFTDLEAVNLYVVSGNTGAGKTTIFDGIAFALYGSASGTDREDAKTLRSDFSDDNVHTAVELEFLLKGRTYRILRQIGHVKKGNKSKTGERYEFFEKVDGKEIPCVDRQIVSEIDKKVETIIGLTQDQFKQIVMLPQGEFRKLLTSQTENKEAILRRLFKTENYSKLNELLRNKKNNVNQDFKQLEQMRDHYIGNITSILPTREESNLSKVFATEVYNVHQIISGLEGEAAFYNEQIGNDEKAYEHAYQAHDREQTAFHQARALNDRFEELDKKENERKRLNEQAPRFAEKEKFLEAAQRASTLEFYEKQAADWRREEKLKEQALKTESTAEEMAQKKLEKAETNYKQEENKQEIREETAKKLDRLTEHLPVVKEIDERKRHLAELERKGKETSARLEKVKAQILEKNKASEMNQERIKKLDQTVGLIRDKEKKLAEMREQCRVLKSYIDLKEKSEILAKDVESREDGYRRTKEKYSEMEKAWLSNQAILLATHLHDGEACPVCGSMEHPSKAISSDEMVTKEELEAFKKVLDEKDGAYRNAQATLKANVAQLQDKEKEVLSYSIELAAVSSVFDRLVADGKQVANEVKLAEKQSEQLTSLKEVQEGLLKETKELEPVRDDLTKTNEDQRATYKAEKAVYAERLRNIPETVRVLSELEKQIRVTKELKLELNRKWEYVQKELQQTKEENTKAAANVAHAKNQLEETRQKRESANLEFKKLMKEADFESFEVYEKAKMSLGEQREWKEEIKQFNQSLASVNQQVVEFRESLQAKKRVDLNVMQEKLTTLKQDYERALHRLNQSKEYYQEATEMRVKIVEVESRVKEREEELATLSDLYDVIRGQNDRKISFERFLQIEYLEQIIEAANGRLKRLSNGQYYLTRSNRQETHGRQSGLALDVYDAYTGQTRDVKTLSGGEKFNASLSLALGMSDVIQSFQGNISIDTMFIDEGFGSLDEESLIKAIDALIELGQTGRMIGVISHVQELKNMFPAILEVKKTREGHSQTEFVLK